MKPPVCLICRREFDPAVELVTFCRTAEDVQWDQQRITGHPPYAEWFCGKHVEQAKKLSHLTLAEARKLMGLEG